VNAPAVIRAGRVLCAPGHAPPLGPSEVHLAGGRITRIVPLNEESLTAEEAGTLLMPALADAHDHGRGLRTLACGVTDQPLETWLPDLARTPRVDPYLNAVVAFARIAESGVCAANHCHNTQDGTALLAEAEAVSRAARDVGITVAFAWPFFDRNATAYGDIDALLACLDPRDRTAVAAQVGAMRSAATNLALMERAAEFEHAGFHLQYCPVAPQWATHATLTAIAEASARDGRRVHMHLLETQRQREWADAHYPGGLIPFLDTLGLLTPRLTVAHAVWLRAEECALLAERGVTVSINPSSNLRLRSGAAPIQAICASGVGFGIGLDGESFDDDEDMLREVRLAWHATPRAAGVPPILSPAELFDAALVIGRRTIVADGGGRIEAGAPADILALDLAAITCDCVTEAVDIAQLLLGRMAKRHVRALFVGGRQIVAEGSCTSVDLPGLEVALTQQARAAYRANPPDLVRIERMQRSIATFYAGRSHCG
jgi:cytosine/adenosine deaminase-related metal-dependent hydrolase